jgi:glycine oxidase
MYDVVVVGGGVIGLSIAREAAVHGKSVVVLDPGTPSEAASWAAAGMLAPQSEADQPDPFFHLCTASLRMHRAWADHLREQTGVDPEHVDSGVLDLASSEEEHRVLDRRMQWQRDAGLAVEMLSPADVRKLEPLLTLPLSGAAWLAGEHQVTPRRLLKALKAACAARGVEIRTGQRVHEVVRSGNRVDGVRVAQDRIAGGCVVIASGVGSAQIAGLQPSIPVRPRKGQILSLATPGPAFRRMIRWRHAYFVPRRDGELIVGATNEDAGFDRSLTPAGIGGLLKAAQEISSHTGEYPIAEMWTGLRPATPDGLPIIGKAELDGLFYATGHYRNGILLAPITAAIIAAFVDGRTPDLPLEPYSSTRFS